MKNPPEPKPKRGRPPKRVMPPLEAASMEELWGRIFANATPPDPALQRAGYGGPKEKVR